MVINRLGNRLGNKLSNKPAWYKAWQRAGLATSKLGSKPTCSSPPVRGKTRLRHAVSCQGPANERPAPGRILVYTQILPSSSSKREIQADSTLSDFGVRFLLGQILKTLPLGYKVAARDFLPGQGLSKACPGRHQAVRCDFLPWQALKALPW